MSRTRSFIVFQLMLIISLLISACTTQPKPTATLEPMSFTDGLGRTVTMEKTAQRVVSLAASNTEILFAVGAGSQVVGRDEFSDYPVEVKDIPTVGGSWGDYNLEAIVALKPDLVLAAEINTAEQVKALADLGLNVYLLPNPLTLDEMYQRLEAVAKMTGHESEAAQLIESLKTRVAAVEEKVNQTQERPLVFYELDATDPAAPYTFGPNTFLDTLVILAGGKNIGGALDTSWAQISAEKVIEMNPAIILLGDAAYGTTPELVAGRPGWSVIDAITNGQTYAFDDNLVSRPGPRLVDGLEALAKLIHPELYK